MVMMTMITNSLITKALLRPIQSLINQCCHVYCVLRVWVCVYVTLDIDTSIYDRALRTACTIRVIDHFVTVDCDSNVSPKYFFFPVSLAPFVCVSAGRGFEMSQTVVSMET